MWRRVSVLLALAGALLLPASAGALTLDPVGTFDRPVFVTSDPADPDRLFVVEQGGTIRLKDGATTTTFLDLTAADPPLVLSGGERGLLSMAFADDYETSGQFYVYYTRAATVDEPELVGDLQVDEFTASGDAVSLATRRPVLTIDHPVNSNHNGGQLQMGPDGYLYVGTGDGGGGGDPDENAQDLDSLLGKLLRINPDQDSPGYSIPSDNPFVDAPGADEIWSYGLRNPWRFSFDRLTNDLIIGDVGQGSWEEVDYEPDDPNAAPPNAGKGDNFGWDCREGPTPFETDPSCTGPTFTEPVFNYSHAFGCSINGGYVVRDASLGDLYGRYLYSDLCVGLIGSMQLALPVVSDFRVESPAAVPFPTSFGEDACGRVYFAWIGDEDVPGGVARLTGDAPADCGPPPQHRLTVLVGGDGVGSVTAEGIACPDDCLQDIDEGAEVTLTATPSGGSTFAGWQGDCTGSAACVVTMDDDRSVTATFDPGPPEPDPEPLPTCGREEATIQAEPGEATVGTQGVDFIVGTPGPDEIRALGGNDAVCGRGGNDVLLGQGGADALKGGKGRDRLRGGRGSDHLAGGTGHDGCAGGPGKDTTRRC